VRLNHRADDVVFGLEVVVDIAERHAGRLRDVRQRRGLDALLVHHLAGGGDQPRPLAGRGRASHRAGQI
jgi:hypothetical protein